MRTTNVRHHYRRTKRGFFASVKSHTRRVLFGKKEPSSVVVRGSDKLSYAEREALPTRDFAEPERRKYPIEDRVHARNALARVAQFGTEAEKRKVRRAVHRRYPNIGRR